MPLYSTGRAVTRRGDVSPSSLNQRLRELRALGVIALGDDGYSLSRSGIKLSRIMLDLYGWAEQMLGKRPPPRPSR